MFCKKCGKEAKSSESFCGHCGNDLRAGGILETKYNDEPKSQWIKDLKNKWEGSSADGPATPHSVKSMSAEQNRREEKSLAKDLNTTSKLGVNAKSPNLFGLVAGISRYDIACGLSNSNLHYPVIDALDIRYIFSCQQGKYYKKVSFYHHIHEEDNVIRWMPKLGSYDPMVQPVNLVLEDEEATRDNLINGLHWIRESAQETDISLVYLSGHGMGGVGYIPAGFDVHNNSTWLTHDTLVKELSEIKGKKILLLDCCHAGAFGVDEGLIRGKGISVAKMDEILTDLPNRPGGLVAISSSTEEQVSVESVVYKNGAFTMAIREGIADGKANYHNDCDITLTSLELYVSKRVKQVNKNQFTTVYKPQSFADFTIAIL